MVAPQLPDAGEVLPITERAGGGPDARIARFADRQSQESPAVEAAARALLEDVRRRGDAAVRDATLRFDHRQLEGLEIPRAEWQRAAGRVAADVRRALEHAHQRISDFHRAEAATLAGAAYTTDAGGVRCELRVRPITRAGLFAPGGTARYPSSVLMTAVPAKVAGVAEVVMVTPGPSDEVLAAALVAGVDRVFGIGGAQAIGALAYGTESVPRVDKIVGPGNAYVAAAKRLVFGVVDIDQVAGPSEVLIVADDSAEPAWVAADLLAQAEHDTEAWAVLCTPSLALAQAVRAEVLRQLAVLPRRAIAEAALSRHGEAVVVGSLDEAVAFANAFAAEHLELAVADAEAVSRRITAAGAIFLGHYTPEAAGDYLAGPNHVLPTGGSARFASPLGVHDFLKRTSVLCYSREALLAHADDIERLATVEGLEAHGRTVAIRLGRPTPGGS